MYRYKRKTLSIHAIIPRRRTPICRRESGLRMLSCHKSDQNPRMEDSKMEKVTRLFLAFVNDESGQDLIEYALIAGLIAVGAIAAMTLLSNNIGNSFNGVGNTISNAS